MPGPLDRTAVADRLELIEAAADFLTTTEAHALARQKLVRLARRVVEDPRLTDEEIVPAAFKVAVALEARARLAAEAVTA